MKLYILSILFSLLFIGCGSYNEKSSGKPSFSAAIVDNAAWYSDSNTDVLKMKVFVPTPNEYNCPPFNNTTLATRPCTMADVNEDTDAYDNFNPKLHVALKIGDTFNLNNSVNAEFKVKGKSTRQSEQKSYRIKLDSKILLFKGERTMQLNKHPYENSRVKNKLAFDLFRTIPNLPSLKTQFVNLEVTELNTTSYGLFTRIESVGKDYLKNRNWNEDDRLYKAQNFGFFEHKELRINTKGDALDPNAFDEVLEVKNGKDHTNLTNMLSAANQNLTNLEIDELFNTYFDRENYITWLAVNLVLANKDTVSQNFYLINPKYSTKFYFLPWDYDGAGRENNRYAKWELGISVWWGLPLHRKFLSIKKNRDDLYLKADLLRQKYITPKIIKNYLDDYNKSIEVHILSQPESDYLSYNRWYNEFWNVLISRLDENIQNYKSQIGHPMAFWQSANYNEGKLALAWERAIDFEGDEIVYDLKIAETLTYILDANGTAIPVLDNVLIEDVAIADTLTLDQDNIYIDKFINLSAGTYYMKVIARETNDASHYQIGFEKDIRVVYNINGKNRSVKYPGVFRFEVK
ncbi:CotH kinase family protein [Sulfurimonas sp. SAG-AH-194-C21]|nr:CotH kinase family protein [Sulfurimonas sp. SAG-AH-194-C21]MDF1883898.1 CotH kinase family protein [Sulfurimonas sp. SAG-AH-194-C21]